MEEDDRNRLRLNRVYLVKNVVVDEILDYLVQSGVLNDENEEIIVKATTKFDKVRVLLDILPRRKNGFQEFCGALKETGSEFIVDQLLSTDLTQVQVIQEDQQFTQKDLTEIQTLLWKQTQDFEDTRKEMEHIKKSLETSKQESEHLKSKLEELEEKASKDGIPEEDLAGYIDRLLQQGPIRQKTIRKQEPTVGTDDVEGVTVSEVKVGVDEVSSESSSTQLYRNTIRIEARLLALDIVHYVAGTKVVSPPNKHARTMRRVVTELYKKYAEAFHEALEKLQISDKTGYSIFSAVADEVLTDGQTNWGRVVAVYAFGAAFAEQCSRKGIQHLVEEVGEFTGKYAAMKICDWILEQGGWDAFDDFFPENATNPKESDSLKKIWMTAVGVSTILGILYSR